MIGEIIGTIFGIGVLLIILIICLIPLAIVYGFIRGVYNVYNKKEE